MPNENSFDPDICGSKRPTYPEKDRFEELYSKLAMNCFDEINDWEQTISEMREIYRALKQENKELKDKIEKIEQQLKTKQDHLFDEDYKNFKDLQDKEQKLEKELNSEKIYSSVLDKESVKLRIKNINLKSSRATKYNQLFYFVKEYQRLEKQNSYLNESNAHLGEDYAVSEANNTDLKKENQNLDALNKLLQEENTRLQNLCTVCVKLNGLEIKNQQLKLELKVAYEDDFKKTKNIYTKQEIDQIEKLQKENERLTEYIKSYSLAATTDIDKYKKDLDLANKRLDNLIRIEKENESLKEQLKKNKYTSSPYSLPPLTPPHHY